MICMICDDQKNELEALEQIVLEYAGEHPELSLEIRCFLTPLAMLEEIDKNGAPDIALLDVYMPGVLGTEAAREILDKSENGADVIFLTASAEFAVEAFSLHASDYLTKPYTKERLAEALDRVVEKRARRLYVPIRCGNEIFRIDLDAVIYVESRNHKKEIHLKSGRCLRTRMTLAKLQELFDRDSGFVTVGASYIVNLRCVQSIRTAELQMTSGDVIPIPRRLRSEVKRRYFDFYTKEAAGQ